MKWQWLLLFLLVASGCSWFPSSVVRPIAVGEIEIDPATLNTVGLSLPVLDGDEDFDASVRVAYREMDSLTWKEALPLQRVRTETLSRVVPSQFAIAEQFAGSIFDLNPDSVYEVRLTIEDPDGGTMMRTARATTRAVPRDAPRSPRVVDVDSADALASALARANPGDVIMLAKGRYKGPFRVERSGTGVIPLLSRAAIAKQRPLTLPVKNTVSASPALIFISKT